jgi:hypothetical protein
LWQRNVDRYNQEVERHNQWWNQRGDEYNATVRNERERIEREQRRWREEVRQERERYRRELQEYQRAMARFRQEQQRAQQQQLQGAEELLEGQAMDILERAQRQLPLRNLLGLDAPRPQTQGPGRPRSNSPPPLGDTWIRRGEARIGIGDHQDLIRTKIRRFLRDTLRLSQRTAQNWGDVADYGTDVALGLIPFLGPLSKAKKAGKTLKVAKTAGRIASGRAKEKVEVKLREPPPAEGMRAPGEGEVGAYGELPPRGDVARHHLPNAEYMRQHGVSRREGVSMYVQQQFGARGGRHIDIHRQPQFQRIPNEIPPRDALGQSVRRVREIYQQDRAYTSDIRRGLQEAVRQNKERFPGLFRRD